jgi:copper chaperone CopZ
LVTVTSSYAVTGMTCEHCVAAVDKSLSALDGVQAVTVDLVPDGDSTVTVFGTLEPDRRAVRSALAAAGYRLAR